jgi:hypothetical protein
MNICLGINSNGLDAELLAGPDNPDGNLTAIGN